MTSLSFSLFTFAFYKYVTRIFSKIAVCTDQAPILFDQTYQLTSYDLFHVPSWEDGTFRWITSSIVPVHSSDEFVAHGRDSVVDMVCPFFFFPCNFLPAFTLTHTYTFFFNSHRYLGSGRKVGCSRNSTTTTITCFSI